VTGNRLPEAFEQLFTAEYPRVVAIANRVLANQHEAEEVAQEVFLSYHRSHDPEAPYARPWLYRAATHTALNVLRGNKRRQLREEADALSGDIAAEDPHGIVEQKEQRQMVRQAMAPPARQERCRPGSALQRPQLRRGRGFFGGFDRPGWDPATAG